MRHNNALTMHYFVVDYLQTFLRPLFYKKLSTKNLFYETFRKFRKYRLFQNVSCKQFSSFQNTSVHYNILLTTSTYIYYFLYTFFIPWLYIHISTTPTYSRTLPENSSHIYTLYIRTYNTILIQKKFFLNTIHIYTENSPHTHAHTHIRTYVRTPPSLQKRIIHNSYTHTIYMHPYNDSNKQPSSYIIYSHYHTHSRSHTLYTHHTYSVLNNIFFTPIHLIYFFTIQYSLLVVYLRTQDSFSTEEARAKAFIHKLWKILSNR